jgi:hypothetical protein
MWLEKLSLGVFRVMTPLGPRYVNPSFAERVYLFWIFRNFETLPARVLSPRQQRWIDRMCLSRGFVSQFGPDAPLLGTLEQRPPVEIQPIPQRRPSQSVAESVAPFAANLRQGS